MAAAGAVPASDALERVRVPIEMELHEYLRERRAELAALDPSSAELVDELVRVIEAGGKRIRPALCFWAYTACAGSVDRSVIRVCASLELLHTFALVHDDVMDEAVTRRGVPTTHERFAASAPPGVEPASHGRAVAVLVGDLAAVLAEQLLRTSGADPRPLTLALGRFDRMRVEMAAGQFLDLSRGGGASSARIAALKTGSYTADGPVLIGAALAGAGAAAEGALRVFARLLGEAFQLRDDVDDGDAPASQGARVDELVDRAVASLDGAPLESEGASALAALAGLLRTARS